MPPEDDPKKPEVLPDDPALTPDPPETPPEELPGEVGPPEEETPQEPSAEPGTEPPAEEEPTADELQQQLSDKDAEIARLRAGERQPGEEPPAQPRVTMAQQFLSTRKPQLRQSFVAEKDEAKRFEILFDTADQLVGAVMHDQIRPVFHSLATANIELSNELEIRDLRAEPEFKALEPQVRAQLKKMGWKDRGQFEEDGSGAVRTIYHRLRGARRNGTPPKPSTPGPKGTPAARAALKDLSAGGGASPRPVGIRLTKDQEADYQGMVENGISLTRTEYYAKWMSRVYQAKSAGRKTPATYRG